MCFGESESFQLSTTQPLLNSIGLPRSVWSPNMVGDYSQQKVTQVATRAPPNRMNFSPIEFKRDYVVDN